ncbi:hypothetical protein EON62_00460 [archaeon]|nr:MAG: hypothetical protein EON62_00460 [archaeon]
MPRVDLGKLVSDMTRRAARRKSAPTTTSVPDQAKDGCPGVDSGHALQHAAADVVGNAPAGTEEDANVGEVVSARQASPSMRSLRTCSGVASPHALTMRGGGLSRSRRALTDMQASYCTTGTNDASSDEGDDVKEEEGARPPSPTSHHRHRSGSWSARGAHAGERSPLRVGSARSHVSRRTASAHSPSRQPPSSDHASPALHTRDGSSQSPTPRSANNELLVMLTSWWPTPAEVDTTLAGLVDPGRFTSRIASLETSHSAQMELPRSRHELRRTKLINRIAQQLEKDMRASPRTARSGTRARRAAGAGAHRGNVLVQADVHPARACTASPAMVATHGGVKASSQSLAADASESVGPHVDALCTRAASRLAALDAQAYARTTTTARASAANSGWAVHAGSLSMDESLLPGSSSHSHSASARALTRSATRRGEAAVPHNLHLRLDSLFLDAPRTGNDTRIGSLLSMDTVGDAVPAAAPDPSLATGAALHLSHPVRVHDTFFAVSPATAYVIPDPSSAFARRILHAPGTASSMVQHNSDVALHAAAAHDGVPIRLETEAAGVASLPPFCAPQVITDDMQQGRSGGKGVAAAAATAAAVASSLPALSGGSGGSALSRTANVVPSLSEAHRKEVVDALWQKIIHRYTVLEKHRLAPDFVALLDFLIAGHMHGQAASEAHVPGATVSSLSSLDLGVDGLPRSPALPARTASRSLRWHPRSRGDGSASGSSARAFDSTMATQGGSVMHDVPSAQEEALNDIYGYLQQLHMQHVCLPSAFVVTPQHGHAAVNRAAEFMETIRAERMAATKQSATATAAMNAALNLAQAMGAGQGGTGVDGAAATGVSHFPAGDKAVVTGGAGTPPPHARTAAVTYPSPFGSMEGIAAGGAIPWAGPHADGAPSAGGAGALLAAERRVVIQAPTTVNLSVPTRTPASSLPSAQRRGVAWVQRAFGSASSPLLGRTPVYEPEEPAQASVSLLSPPPSTRPAPGKPSSSVHLSPLHVRNALVASLPPRRGARSPPPPMVTLADVPEAVYALELSREAFNLPPAPKWLQQASSGKFKVGSISVPTASRTTSAYAQVLSSGPLLSSATISNLRTSTASLPTRSQHRSSRR